MSDLKVDTQVLRDAAENLRTVASEFENANKRVDEHAWAVGDETLAEQIENFAHGWDDKRAEMLDKIKGLAEAAKKCGEAYEKVETELYKELIGEGNKKK